MSSPETLPALHEPSLGVTNGARGRESGSSRRVGHSCRGHAVQFYDDERFLAVVVSDFVAQGLAAHEPIVVLATRDHCEAFAARLRIRGIDVEEASRTARLTFLDARETLSSFMTGATLDASRCRSGILSLLEQRLPVGALGRPVRIYGEMVDLLSKDGNIAAALRLEEIWNELAEAHGFSLVCGYAMDSFRLSSHTDEFRTICNEHAYVVPTEQYLKHDEANRMLEISLLQQRARALESEIVQRELAHERERAARAEAERARLDADRARMLAERANRSKSEFLAIMSHELRTPLNAIGGYVELLELGIHGPVSPQQHGALERIQRSQRLLLGLINQVLNYARIETGNIRYDIQRLSLEDILRAAESIILPQIRAKGLQYRYAGCDPGVQVYADGEKVQQIVLNLLTNAVKFTDRGGDVWLEVVPSDGSVLIHVCDTGVGIDGDKLEEIFDPFVQVDGNYTRTREGVGLGLAISRDLARGMDGNLAVESEPGKGSVFTLQLPSAG